MFAKIAVVAAAIATVGGVMYAAHHARLYAKKGYVESYDALLELDGNSMTVNLNNTHKGKATHSHKIIRESLVFANLMISFSKLDKVTSKEIEEFEQFVWTAVALAESKPYASLSFEVCTGAHLHSADDSLVKPKYYYFTATLNNNGVVYSQEVGFIV